MIRATGGPGAPHWAISGDDFATRARLVYAGQHRALMPERRELLRKWASAFQVNPAVLDEFTQEYLFREDSTDLWIAVQRVLEEPLTAEASPGKSITGFVTFLGGHYEGGPVTWLFLLNEFDAFTQ